MKKHFLILFLCLTVTSVQGQLTKEEIEQSRKDHLTHLTDTSFHLLNQEEIDAFPGLDYFEFDKQFQVVAKFTKDKGRKFKMPTSTERLPVYRRYGFLDFEIDGKACRLEIYQSMSLKRQKEYKNYLFLPFKDATAPHLTYGGGRFIETEIPEGDEMLIDFNTAFNPYCAYSPRYSCPIPPEQNTLDVEIRAGEKVPLAH